MNIKLVLKFLFICFAFSLPLQALTEGKENSPSDEGRELSSVEQFLQNSEAFVYSDFEIAYSFETAPPLTPEQRKKFPPPSNRNELPQPVQQHIQEIEDLCKIDSLEVQAQEIKKTLVGLSKTINFYLAHYNQQIINKVTLSKIHSHLFGINIIFQWRYVDAGFRRDYDEYFIFNRAYGYMLEEAGPKSFNKRPWLHKIYRGLYCLSHGTPPPVETI